jgi:hypothetical protein
MIIPKGTPARQRVIAKLLGELAVQTALVSARQSAYVLALDINSAARSARFFAYGVSQDVTKQDWSDNLGFSMHEACKKPIWFDLFSLQDVREFETTVQFLKKALATAKRL